MAKWIYDNNDLVAEVNVGGDYIEKSGAYEVTIEKVEEKVNPTGSEQIAFTFKSDGGQSGTVYVVYVGKEGQFIDFKVRQLNQLCGILKVTPDKIQAAIGKKVGIFLKAKLSNCGKYINTDLDGFYNPKTKLTTSEVAGNVTTPDTYNKLVEKYAKDIPLIRGGDAGSAGASPVAKVPVDDSSFPF